MADLLRLWKQRGASAVKMSADAPEEGFLKGEQFPLPPGEIVASEGVQLLQRPRLGRGAIAVEHEAWIVVCLGHSCCNAIWRPDQKGWDVIKVDLSDMGCARLLSRTTLPDVKESSWL